MCRCSWRVIETSLAFAKAPKQNWQAGGDFLKICAKELGARCLLSLTTHVGKAPQSSFPTPNGARRH